MTLDTMTFIHDDDDPMIYIYKTSVLFVRMDDHIVVSQDHRITGQRASTNNPHRRSVHAYTLEVREKCTSIRKTLEVYTEVYIVFIFVYFHVILPYLV